MSASLSRRATASLLAVLTLCLLSACGQKGPLTRPRGEAPLAQAAAVAQEPGHAA